MRGNRKMSLWWTVLDKAKRDKLSRCSIFLVLTGAVNNGLLVINRTGTTPFHRQMHCSQGSFPSPRAGHCDGRFRRTNHHIFPDHVLIGKQVTFPVDAVGEGHVRRIRMESANVSCPFKAQEEGEF
jgi:hypothetical protein